MQLLPQKEFRYYLTYEGVRTLLVFAPEDFDKDTIGQYKRETYYGGVMRTMSLPLTFALDAYSILKKAFIKYSYAAEVIFEVEQLNHSTMVYESKFNSLLDFSMWDDSGINATLTLLDNSVFAGIKAQETTVFEYPLTGPDVVNVILPGVAFSEYAIWTPKPSSGAKLIVPIGIVVDSVEVNFIEIRSTEAQEIPSETQFLTSENWFVKSGVNSDTTLIITGDIQGQVLSGGGAVEIRNNLNEIVKTIFTSNSPQAIDQPFDFQITLRPNEKLFLYLRTNSGLGGSISNGEMKVSYSSVSDPSNCKGIKIYDLYARIMRRIAPTAAIDSFLLSKSWLKDLVLISGNAIRENPTATINISFKEFFDSCNAWESAGFGLDSGFYRIEQLPFFYRPTPILSKHLDVNSCHFITATDLLISSVEVGYNDGNTDSTDGQFEYNSKQEWRFPQNIVAKKENWMSPIRADQYGIEKLRRDYIRKTNDTSSDNDTFAVHCYLDGVNYKPILGSSYVSVTGMASELANNSSYNLSLTPKENLIRHGRYIKSLFDKLENRFIEFGSAEKNKELTFVRQGNPSFRLKQNESIPISSLPDKYFKPVYATITAKLPVNFMSLVDSSGGFGYLSFSWYDKIYNGYIIEASTDLALNTEREIKLLLTSENDY